MHAVPGRQHGVRRRTAWLTSARASEGTHVSRKAGEREVQTGAGGRAGAGRAERDEGGRKAQRGASRHGVSAAPRRHRRVRGGAQRRRAIACRGARARSTTNHDAHIPAPRRPSQCQARHTHLPASSAARCASPKGQRAPRTQGLPRTSLSAHELNTHTPFNPPALKGMLPAGGIRDVGDGRGRVSGRTGSAAGCDCGVRGRVPRRRCGVAAGGAACFVRGCAGSKCAARAGVPARVRRARRRAGAPRHGQRRPCVRTQPPADRRRHPGPRSGCGGGMGQRARCVPWRRAARETANARPRCGAGGANGGLDKWCSVGQCVFCCVHVRPGVPGALRVRALWCQRGAAFSSASCVVHHAPAALAERRISSHAARTAPTHRRQQAHTVHTDAQASRAAHLAPASRFAHARGHPPPARARGVWRLFARTHAPARSLHTTMVTRTAHTHVAQQGF